MNNWTTTVRFSFARLDYLRPSSSCSVLFVQGSDRASTLSCKAQWAFCATTSGKEINGFCRVRMFQRLMMHFSTPAFFAVQPVKIMVQSNLLRLIYMVAVADKKGLHGMSGKLNPGFNSQVHDTSIFPPNPSSATSAEWESHKLLWSSEDWANRIHNNYVSSPSNHEENPIQSERRGRNIGTGYVWSILSILAS